ncbi:hypothetical protein VP1G_00418 [Cytospora mali]|uniref:NADH:ubiquinone oxidoreductase intermediate-associated protein 30 domain-containing protein n=1 Tax=Cytospora mali TaxID=578113 RepID=A0A194UN54_CYTMA|nr:hypothetical protein VP1G_00418 [Valsa mali var. pyri (nom. inval.)]
MYLFGGDKPWDASQFTASDDRVRGGKSQSYLTVIADDAERNPGGGSRAEFSGHLDITALGGAGFASQRTVDDAVPPWDLSGYDTLVLDVARGDGKKYTVTLKDEVLPRGPDGREQSTVSWEYDFVVGGADGQQGGGDPAAGSHRVVIPFRDLRPTYRGRPKPDAKPLDWTDVKRFTFMMRSFFGEQEGDFSIIFNSVAVEKREEERRDCSVDSVADAKQAQEDSAHKGSDKATFSSWVGRLCGWGR